MREDNDPELNGKYLGTITKDFIKVSDTLKEASYQVRSRKFSQFPVFPVCKTAQPIGQLLIGNTDIKVDWNYYITYLDEFIQRKLVTEDSLEDFKKSYKDPDEYCCLFVVDEDFTSFVYIPYPND
ncbi:hypothetical protein GCM10007049_38260 [Echinicola pacifica]|uniref:Uncharacterized protein n=1 Tax=Echinicola pacifica TaxID=346377 RepID=A0A918UY19_9BACT|nr:hypothetical protein [Echinicola pacifica]GGZ41244.1 hypothetical protein GCM10007049_38260 [Echinicola pacifica]